jgi:hypothetical protein
LQTTKSVQLKDLFLLRRLTWLGIGCHDSRQNDSQHDDNQHVDTQYKNTKPSKFAFFTY